MSTIKALMLASLAASSFGLAQPHRQIGARPIKLTGPSYITSMRPTLGMTSRLMPSYSYKVTMDQTSTSDEVLNITESGHLFSHNSTTTVPAGALEKNFSMTPIGYGTTTLTLSNGNGSVSMDITVEP